MVPSTKVQSYKVTAKLQTRLRHIDRRHALYSVKSPQQGHKCVFGQPLQPGAHDVNRVLNARFHLRYKSTLVLGCTGKILIDVYAGTPFIRNIAW